MDVQLNISNSTPISPDVDGAVPSSGATETAVATDPVPARRERGRPTKRKHAENSNTNIVASPERRSSRYAEQNGDCALLVSVNGNARVIRVVAEAPTKWEMVKVVLSTMDVMVKVFCVNMEPNFLVSWQMKRQYSSISSGFIIGGRRVLMNAHSGSLL